MKSFAAVFVNGNGIQLMAFKGIIKIVGGGKQGNRKKKSGCKHFHQIVTPHAALIRLAG
jgi:hypothetical protein